MNGFREMKPSDVLIVGSGLSGLRAGIEATAKGMKVRVLCKEKLGAATSSVLSNGYITRCPEEGKEKLLEEMLWAGGGLNDQHLVGAFLEDVTKRVEELKDWGVNLVVVEQNPPHLPGLYKVVSEKGKPAGYPLVRRLREICQAQGVEFIEEVMIFSLLRDEDRVVGALGVDLRGGELLLFPTKSLVLATGGGAALFKRHNNAKGTIGEGFVLGLEAGTALVNLEFVIFDVPPPIFSRILKGDWEEGFLEEANAHYFLGGLEINEQGETAVKGLFAGGEVTGNLFGAGRLGGSAMADVLVFGARAGAASAEWASLQNSSSLNGQAEEEQRKLENRLKGKLSSRWVKQEVKRIMWEYCGIYKTEERLKAGLEKLQELKEEGVSKEDGWRDVFEAVNMLELGELLIRASLARKETRGSFWRPDYPQPDNQHFLRNLLILKEGANYNLSWKDIRMINPYFPKEIPVAPGCFSYRF